MHTFTSLCKNLKGKKRKELKYGEGKKYVFVVLLEKTDHNIYYPERWRVRGGVGGGGLKYDMPEVSVAGNGWASKPFYFPLQFNDDRSLWITVLC